MVNHMMTMDEIERTIQNALEEDIGTGDVTTVAIVPSSVHIVGEFIVKSPGVVAGLDIAGRVFLQMDDEIVYTPLVPDGSAVMVGDIVARMEGRGSGILTAERVALNFLQRMSGIATMTQRYVAAVAGSKAKILDTRKTVPGLRTLDKMAVRLGGGTNHRLGLYDMVLIKDNHSAVAGGVAEAVRLARARAGGLAIEVEVQSLKQLDEVLALDVDRVMLDNMSVEDMREAVRRAKGVVALEASGGITLDNVAAVAATGVDFISVGALTHSVTALDISLEAAPGNSGQVEARA